MPSRWAARDLLPLAWRSASSIRVVADDCREHCSATTPKTFRGLSERGTGQVARGRQYVRAEAGLTGLAAARHARPSTAQARNSPRGWRSTWCMTWAARFASVSSSSTTAVQQLPAAAGIVRVARADEVAQRGDRHFCIGVGIDETIQSDCNFARRRVGHFCISERFTAPPCQVHDGVPRGIRTPVTAVKGRCPRPLDDGDEARCSKTIARNNEYKKQRSRKTILIMVEVSGIEPLTSCMPCKRSPS